MRIGISVLTHPGQSVWENGIGQNVVYLAKLMRHLPFVSSVVLLNTGDQNVTSAGVSIDALDCRLVPPREATDLIDVAIELSGGLDLEWIDYIRALGKKVVFHCCGHPYTSLVEPSIFECSGFFSRADRCDEVWILPRDGPFRTMLQAIHRCPVFQVPYVWDPMFIQGRADELADLGYQFGCVEGSREYGGSRQMRAAIFEPNISVTKSCFIPLLICDEAVRREPDVLSDVKVLNSVQLAEHRTFAGLVNSLDLAALGRIRLDSRHDFAGYMVQHADLVVTHQWQHDQNTLYLDALYGGYPIVHNSQWLGSVGYYYNDFDISAGAAQLINAVHGHGSNLIEYRRTAHQFLANLDPLSPHNLDAYARRLLGLTSGSHGAMHYVG